MKIHDHKVTGFFVITERGKTALIFLKHLRLHFICFVNGRLVKRKSIFTLYKKKGEFKSLLLLHDYYEVFSPVGPT